MFIPRNKNPKVGDIVFLNKDVETLSGTFTKGHKMKVMGIDNTIRGTEIYLIDDNGNRISDCSPKNLSF